MGSFGLKTFALGMNEEITNLGKLAMGTDFSDPTAFPTMGTPQPAVPNQGTPFVPPTQAAVPPPAAMPPQPTYGGGDDPSGMFAQLEAEHGLPSGTLMHLYGLESSYGKNLKNPNSSASGPFQFIKSTAKQYGLDANSVMKLGPSAKAAAKLGAANKAQLTKVLGREPTIGELYLAHQQGGAGAVGLLSNPDARAADIVGEAAVVQNGGSKDMTAGQFASLWTSKVPGQPGPGGVSMSTRDNPHRGDDLGVDTSKLEELAGEDADPAKKKRQFQGSLLMGLGQGISDIAHGNPADISNVMDAYYQRQSEARERLMEIQMERRRQQEREQSRGWELEDQATAEQQQIAAEERGEARDIAGEERDISRIDRRNEAMSNSLALLYPDSPHLQAAQEVMKLNPEVGLAWMEQKSSEEKEQAKLDLEAGQRDEIAQVYDEQGMDDIATMVRNGDLVGARDIYKERTGATDAQLDAKVLQQGGPNAVALAQRLRLEAGLDATPQEKAAVDLTAKGLEKEYDGILANREKAGQLEAMQAVLEANPDMDTGAFQSAMLPFRQILRDFGIGDTAQVDQQTVVNAIGNNLISYMRKPGEGVVSDADADRFAAAAPGLGKSPVANQVLTYVHLNTLRREEAAYNARMEYFAKNGDVGDGKARDAYVKSKVQEQFGEGPMIAQVDKPEDAVHVEQGKPYLFRGKFYVNGPNGPEG